MSLIPKAEAKYLHGILTNKQYKQFYQRVWQETHSRREYHRENMRLYYKIHKAEILARQHKREKHMGKRHKGDVEFVRDPRKTSFTYCDLIAITSMERLAGTVNRIINGELMLTFNTRGEYNGKW